jgi:hypothetical protein
MSNPESYPHSPHDDGEIIDAILVDEHGREIPNEGPTPGAGADGPGLGVSPYGTDENQQSRENHAWNTGGERTADADANEGWRRSGYYEGRAAAAERASRDAEATAGHAARAAAAAERRAAEEAAQAQAADEARARAEAAHADAERTAAQAAADRAAAEQVAADAESARLKAEQDRLAAEQRALDAEKALQDRLDAEAAAAAAEQQRLDDEAAARDREMRARPRNRDEEDAAARLRDIAERVSKLQIINTTTLRGTLGIASGDNERDGYPGDARAEAMAWGTMKELVRQGFLTSGDPDRDQLILTSDASSDVAARASTLAGSLHVVPVRPNGLTPGEKHAARLDAMGRRRPGDEFMTAFRATSGKDNIKMIRLDREKEPADPEVLQRTGEVVSVANQLDSMAEEHYSRTLPFSIASIPRFTRVTSRLDHRMSRWAAKELASERMWGSGGENPGDVLRDEMQLVIDDWRQKNIRPGEPVPTMPDPYDMYADRVTNLVSHLSVTGGKGDVHARTGAMERREAVRHGLANAFRDIDRRYR